jgi:hypothetical protein
LLLPEQVQLIEKFVWSFVEKARVSPNNLHIALGGKENAAALAI